MVQDGTQEDTERKDGTKNKDRQNKLARKRYFVWNINMEAG
jgi:hypothetical protein